MNPTELGAGGHGGAAGSGSPGDSSGGSGGAGGGSAGTGGSGGGVGGVSGDGLPCEVEQLLTTYCVSCHGTRLAGGAPMALVTYADLTAPDPSQPAKSAAAVSLARMSNSAAPMPPSAPMPSASAIAAFASWVNAGTPATSCGGSDGGVDGGSSDPLGAAPTCTSGKSWPNGNTGSSSMNPGLACISCHNANNGPRFTIAGTVYPTGHEPDLCNGTNQAKVVITDAAGKQVTLTPNSVGNFSSTTTLKLPYKAQLVIGTSVRAMASAQTSGDCNSCHTQSGSSGAPGRVTTPAL